MSEMRPFIFSGQSLTITANGKPVTINRGDRNFDAVLAAVKEGNWDTIDELAIPAQTIMNMSDDLVVTDGSVYYRGEEVHNYVVDKILNFSSEGLPSEPLINFLKKLLENPSKRCVDRLFKFLEHGNMPIDPDGDFYAYKAVRHDWTDKYTGKILNKIGSLVSFPRNKVDDNPSIDCSYGLHAGALQYIKNFKSAGDNVIIVKINPADVVSVPESDCSKLRCCKYVITGVYEGPLPENTYTYKEDYEYEDSYEEDEDYEERAEYEHWR